VRICSLVPGATEVLFELGLGQSVVGVTHECDWPQEAESRPRVTASHLQSGDLSSSEIDAAVAEAAREGKALYAVDEAVWEEIQADVVFTAHLASVLKTMALDGRGVAGLPKTLIGEDLASGRLVAVGEESWSIAVDIRLFRQEATMHPAAEKFWRTIVAPRMDTA